MTAFGLRSSRVIVGGAERSATVVIDGETIAAVTDGPVSVPVEDLGDLVLMSGLVDCHVHINEPGRTEWEGFESATRAAAAGGITSVIDMPLNCTPVTTTAEALQLKLQACAPHLWVDVGFWGGVVPGSRAHLGALTQAGIKFGSTGDRRLPGGRPRRTARLHAHPSRRRRPAPVPRRARSRG